MFIYEFEAGVSYPCQKVAMISDNVITCVLPYIARFDSETLLPIRVQAGGQYGNWLYGIGYSNTLSSSSSSPSYLPALITCAVFLFVFIVLFILSLMYIAHLRGLADGTRKSPRSMMSEREESGWGNQQGASGVELS